MPEAAERKHRRLTCDPASLRSKVHCSMHNNCPPDPILACFLFSVGCPMWGRASRTKLKAKVR
jgi:hypothetical protein